MMMIMIIMIMIMMMIGADAARGGRGEARGGLGGHEERGRRGTGELNQTLNSY